MKKVRKTYKKSQVDQRRIAAKAQQVLGFAEERAQRATDWLELDMALFGVDGKASELFATEAERTAFCKTPQYRRILDLLNQLPWPPVQGSIELPYSLNGKRRQGAKKS